MLGFDFFQSICNFLQVLSFRFGANYFQFLNEETFVSVQNCKTPKMSRKLNHSPVAIKNIRCWEKFTFLELFLYLERASEKTSCEGRVFRVKT